MWPGLHGLCLPGDAGLCITAGGGGGRGSPRCMGMTGLPYPCCWELWQAVRAFPTQASPQAFLCLCRSPRCTGPPHCPSCSWSLTLRPVLDRLESPTGLSGGPPCLGEDHLFVQFL